MKKKDENKVLSEVPKFDNNKIDTKIEESVKKEAIIHQQAGEKHLPEEKKVQHVVESKSEIPTKQSTESDLKQPIKQDDHNLDKVKLNESVKKEENKHDNIKSEVKASDKKEEPKKEISKDESNKKKEDDKVSKNVENNTKQNESSKPNEDNKLKNERKTKRGGRSHRSQRDG